MGYPWKIFHLILAADRKPLGVSEVISEDIGLPIQRRLARCVERSSGIRHRPLS